MEEYCDTSVAATRAWYSISDNGYGKVNCRACDNCLPNALPPSEAIVTAQKILRALCGLKESCGLTAGRGSVRAGGPVR
jgi:hypothetical protein